MSNSKKDNNKKEVETKIDLSKISTPLSSNVDNSSLLKNIVEMCENKFKSNPQFPFVGVKEIANDLNDKNDNLILDQKDVRRKLQKIRKSQKEQYDKIVDIKNGEIILEKNNIKNCFDEPLLIKWVNRSNKVGIEYLIVPTSKLKQ